MNQVAVADIDLDRLFKLRIAIARAGEMDNFGWWNTRGQLGPVGTKALRRGLPRTHRFAQARSVCALAAHRCGELSALSDRVTLWNLPVALEEALDARFETWLDNTSAWEPFFLAIEALGQTDLRQVLRGHDLVTDHDLEAVRRLRRPASGRVVEIPALFSGSDSNFAQLALGFTLGGKGSLVVPSMRASR